MGDALSLMLTQHLISHEAAGDAAVFSAVRHYRDALARYADRYTDDSKPSMSSRSVRSMMFEIMDGQFAIMTDGISGEVTTVFDTAVGRETTTDEIAGSGRIPLYSHSVYLLGMLEKIRCSASKK